MTSDARIVMAQAVDEISCRRGRRLVVQSLESSACPDARFVATVASRWPEESPALVVEELLESHPALGIADLERLEFSAWSMRSEEASRPSAARLGSKGGLEPVADDDPSRINDIASHRLFEQLTGIVEGDDYELAALRKIAIPALSSRHGIVGAIRRSIKSLEASSAEHGKRWAEVAVMIAERRRDRGEATEKDAFEAIAVHSLAVAALAAGHVEQSYDERLRAATLYNDAGVDETAHLVMRLHVDLRRTDSADLNPEDALQRRFTECGCAHVDGDSLTWLSIQANGPRQETSFRQDCCDDCRKVFDDAIQFAIWLGISDARKAWWLVNQVDKESRTPARAVALFARGEVDGIEPPTRESILSEAHAVAMQAGNLHVLAFAKVLYGNALRHVSNDDASLRFFAKANDLDPWCLAQLYYYRGAFFTARSRHREALRDLALADVEYCRLQATHNRGLCRLLTAQSTYESGRSQEALQQLDLAARELDFKRFPRAISGIQMNRGMYLCDLGHFDQAAACFGSLPAEGSNPIRSFYLGLVALSKSRRGYQSDLSSAAAMFMNSAERFAASDDLHKAAYSTLLLAEVHVRLNDAQEALPLLADAASFLAVAKNGLAATAVASLAQLLRKEATKATILAHIKGLEGEYFAAK